MFFLSITRRPVADRIDAPSVREFPAGALTVTTATDDWLSHAGCNAGRVVLREAAPLGQGGMPFAEIVSDHTANTLELHKSALGGRFFYFHFGRDGAVYCASHISLLRAAGVPIEEDPRRLPEFFVYRYTTAPATLYRGIDQMQAGQTLRYEWDGREWKLRSSQLFQPPTTTTGNNLEFRADGLYAEYGRRTTDALRDAVAALKPAGERTQVLLSGGLDSSILYRLAQRELGVGDSYSASYPFEPEEQDVEKRYALTAADALGARHRLFVPTTGHFLRGFVQAAHEMEEPVVHLQSLLMMLMLREGMPTGRAPVVLGEGADGAWGMRMHANMWKLDGKAGRYRKLRSVLGLSPVLGALRPASRLLGRGGDLVEVMEKRWDPQDPLTDMRHALWRQHVVCDEQWVRDRFGPAARVAVANRQDVMRPYQGRSVFDLISLQSFLADASMVQRQWSRLAESADKWAYYPFHDPRVLTEAYSTPWRVKLAEPKAVLRGVARRIGVPEVIINRPKADFSANARHWALPGGVLEPIVALATKVWPEEELRKVQTLYMPKAYTFLAMLNYALWKRLHLRGESPATLLSELDEALARQSVAKGEELVGA